MEYKLRKLKATDAFLIIKLINKFGIMEFKKCFNANEIAKLAENKEGLSKEELTEKVGFNIILSCCAVIFENIGKCENEVFEFLSAVSNLNRKQVECLSLAELAQMIIEIFQKDEFKDFYKVVSGLLKQEKSASWIWFIRDIPTPWN